jgi:hypothetical protein
LVGQHPDAEEQLRQLFKVLSDIEDVAGHTATSVGESQEWRSIVSTVEETRANYCKALPGKTFYSTLYGTYKVTMQELKSLLKANIHSEGNETEKKKTTVPSQQDEGFKEVRRRKQQNSHEPAEDVKKAVTQGKAPATVNTSPKEVATRNFLVLLRTTGMETDSVSTETTPPEISTAKAGRPPPIILTSVVNLIQLQEQLNNVVKE